MCVISNSSLVVFTPFSTYLTFHVFCPTYYYDIDCNTGAAINKPSKQMVNSLLHTINIIYPTSPHPFPYLALSLTIPLKKS